MIHPLTLPYMALVIFTAAFYYVPAVQEDLQDKRIKEDLQKGWILVPIICLILMVAGGLK